AGPSAAVPARRRTKTPATRAAPTRARRPTRMVDAFGDRVAAAVRATGPLCAGIDPSPELLRDWGLTDDPDGLRTFGATCVYAFAGEVGVIKPQVAFFERHGAAGMAELERLVAHAKAAGLL